MHFKETLHIGCTDCHGGDAQQKYPDPGTTRYCPAAPQSGNERLRAGRPPKGLLRVPQLAP